MHATPGKFPNPYDPPKIDLRFTPIHKRFWYAAKLAFREYRAGLVRENFTYRAHAKAWLALAMISVFVLFNVVGLTVSLVHSLGLL